MLRDLNASQLQALLKAVESRLAASPTKSEVIRTVAQEGHCSSTTTTVPATLLKLLKENSVPLTPRFSALMGETVSVITRVEALAAPLAQPTDSVAVDPDKPSVVNVRILNLKAVSSIEVGKKETKVSFIDGETVTLGSFDDAEFRSNCNLIAFNG